MRKFFAAAILSSLCAIFCACGRADIVVSRWASENASVFPEEGSVAVIVNISSGTFHLDENCRYVANMKEENKKIIFYSDAGVALKDGFKPCSACAEEYKKTEEKHG